MCHFDSFESICSNKFQSKYFNVKTCSSCKYNNDGSCNEAKAVVAGMPQQVNHSLKCVTGQKTSPSCIDYESFHQATKFLLKSVSQNSFSRKISRVTCVIARNSFLISVVDRCYFGNLLLTACFHQFLGMESQTKKQTYSRSTISKGFYWTSLSRV